ncbi:hypothetical protein ACLMJK_002208 [Lecanora helva]
MEAHQKCDNHPWLQNPAEIDGRPLRTEFDYSHVLYEKASDTEITDEPRWELPTCLSHNPEFGLPQSNEIPELPQSNDGKYLHSELAAHTVQYERAEPPPYVEIDTLLQPYRPELLGDLPNPEASPAHVFQSYFQAGDTFDVQKPDTSKPLPSLPRSDCSTLESRSNWTSKPLSRPTSNCTLAHERPLGICRLATERQQFWTEIIQSAHGSNDKKHLKDLAYQPLEVEGLTANVSGDSELDFEQDKVSHEVSLTPDLPVQELLKFVSVVNKEWRNKLQPLPDLFSACSMMTVETLFERGLIALQRLFRAQLVDSFDDIFALVHVGWASAYSLHGEDATYSWDIFFQDILTWRYAITKESHSLLFTKLMHNFYCSSRCSESSCACDSATKPSRDTMYHTLRNGRVVEDFSRFLDSLDHTIIPARDGQLLTAFSADEHEMNIEKMIYQMIEPLKQQSGIEAFLPSIKYTEHLLHSRLLHNPHEVEVTLLSSGKRHSQSFRLYDKYRARVKDLSDQVMRQPDGNWRNPYYAAALDSIFLITLKMLHRPKVPSSKACEPTRNHAPQTPTSTPLAEREGVIDDSPTSTFSNTSAIISDSSMQYNSIISPLTDYNESISTSSPSSQASGAGEAHPEYRI